MGAVGRRVEPNRSHPGPDDSGILPSRKMRRLRYAARKEELLRLQLSRRDPSGDRSRVCSVISKAQISFGFSGGFWPSSLPLFHGVTRPLVVVAVSMSCSYVERKESHVELGRRALHDPSQSHARRRSTVRFAATRSASWCSNKRVEKIEVVLGEGAHSVCCEPRGDQCASISSTCNATGSVPGFGVRHTACNVKPLANLQYLARS